MTVQKNNLYYTEYAQLTKQTYHHSNNTSDNTMTTWQLARRLHTCSIGSTINATFMHASLLFPRDTTCFLVIVLRFVQYNSLLGATVVQRVACWTFDQQVVGSNPTRGKAMYNLYNLVLAKGQWFFAAGKVTAGLVEMAAYRWGGLTACTPGSAPGPTLGNEYGKPLYQYYVHCKRTRVVTVLRCVWWCEWLWTRLKLKRQCEGINN